jgi:hypothetical protein
MYRLPKAEILIEKTALTQEKAKARILNLRVNGLCVCAS